MKKVFFIACLFYGLQAMQSQIQFGIKGGVNYNSESIEEDSKDVFSGAKSKTGYHAGIWLRGKLPLLGLYIRPELVYTSLSNQIFYSDSPTIQKKATTYDFQKIDLPVLLGKKVLNFLHIYGGPSFQYILDADFDIDDIGEVDSDGFSLGVQFGAGLEIGKLGIDLRWERALSDTESSIVSSNFGDVTFDTRVNQIIVGLSYRF